MKICVPVIVAATALVDIEEGRVDEVLIALPPERAMVGADHFVSELASEAAFDNEDGVWLPIDDPRVQIALGIVDNDDSPKPQEFTIDYERSK